MLLPETKAVAILIKIAPASAAIALVAALQVDSTNEGWTWLWRIGLTAALTVFTTLVGILYRDMRAALREMRTTQVANHRENGEAIGSIAARQERMIGVLTMLPMMIAKPGGAEEAFRYIQEIQKVLER